MEFDDTDFNDDVTILELDNDSSIKGLNDEISPFTKDLLKVVTPGENIEEDVLEGLDMDFDDMLVDESVENLVNEVSPVKEGVAVNEVSPVKEGVALNEVSPVKEVSPVEEGIPVKLDESQTVDVHGAVGAQEVAPPKVDKKEEAVSADMMKDVIKELIEKIKVLNEELAEERNRKLRIAADMENLRKRNTKNQDLAISRVQIEMLGEFLPVVDHLEMALQHASESSSIVALQEGVQMVLKQFNVSLSKFGVTAKDALGEVFDPNIHEAMAQEDSDLYASGIVISQWQKAYVIGDKLVRPARVVVSKGPGPQEDEIPESES
jgi:molecular chaperone GrpE